jgi:hypothetical protein
VNGDREWLRVEAPATECARIKASFLEREKRAMGERKFRQEFLCEFVGNDESLFDEELIQSLIRQDVPSFLKEFGHG